MFGIDYLKKFRRRLRAKKRIEPLLAGQKRSPVESDDQAPPPPPPQPKRAEPLLRSQPIDRSRPQVLPPDHPSFWNRRGNF